MREELKLVHPFNIVVVGKRRHGKTTFVKKLLKKVDKENVIIYDPNNEYKGYGLRYMFYENLIRDLEGYRNKVIVIEDATAKLNNKEAHKELLHLLIRSRHLNCSVIAIFHSLRSIPVQLFDNIDKIIAFRTNDRVDLIKKKFEGILSEKDIEEIRNLPPFNFVVHNF